MENNPGYGTTADVTAPTAIPENGSRGAKVRQFLDEKGITPKLDDARAYVEEHKVILVGMGLGLGFGLGFLFGRIVYRD